MLLLRDAANRARQGFVIGTNGKSPPHPMRLQVTPDTIILQKEEFSYVPNVVENIVAETDSRERKVKVVRQKIGGLGISIKGGAEHKLPILISRITKNQAADHTGQLFVGDAILKVNDKNLEGSNHDDAVNTLRNAGDHVVLTVRHYGGAAPFLKGCLKKHSKEDDEDENIHESSTLRLEEKEQQHQQAGASTTNSQGIKLDKKWTEFISIPLLMAFVTRYAPGTDKLRTDSFEVHSADGELKAIVQCEDERNLNEWIGMIASNIAEMTNQQMKAFNKNLAAEEQILWMGWVEEGIETVTDDSSPTSTSTTARCAWHPRFLALKGSELFLLDAAPTSGKDWAQGQLHVKVYQTALGVLKENECASQRNNCFVLQISSGKIYCLAMELQSSLAKLEMAWHRAIYNAVTKLGSKTFAVTGRNGRSAALTLDWNLGFALYDTEEKNYLWHYRFSQLKGSSDDGKLRLKLHFQSAETRDIETKELESGTLPDLLYCMHAFLTAKVVSVDPNFLANN